ncbi:hypothetical protein BKA70DRAFT_1576514 [Coprinopsis sp. MPI-PUGE-AT-0042]|nr:hypothetical protein BKA70DRAFT_1576514 [Coprinopsis sp. MPI-PUGE-AT-0042]
MRTKCDLTLVCKLWWTIGQGLLFEFLWLTAREASLPAALLSDVSIRSADVSVGAGVVEEPAAKSKVLGMAMMGKRKENVRVAGFEGISVPTTISVSYSTSPPPPPPSSSSSHIHPRSPSLTSSATSTGAYAFTHYTCAIRRRMRRQHTETHSLDRCSPQDGLTILTHAPTLQVFSASRSIRRTGGFVSCRLRLRLVVLGVEWEHGKVDDDGYLVGSQRNVDRGREA